MIRSKERIGVRWLPLGGPSLEGSKRRSPFLPFGWFPMKQGTDLGAFYAWLRSCRLLTRDIALRQLAIRCHNHVRFDPLREPNAPMSQGYRIASMRRYSPG